METLLGYLALIVAILVVLAIATGRGPKKSKPALAILIGAFLLAFGGQALL